MHCVQRNLVASYQIINVAKYTFTALRSLAYRLAEFSGNRCLFGNCRRNQNLMVVDAGNDPTQLRYALNNATAV